MNVLEVTLKYTGHIADEHQIDLYDVSQALIGFERSLALTTHLILNGEIITQAPALRGAKIFARPSRPGSWELTAAIAVFSAAAGVVYKLGTAPKDTPIGHLIRSTYDYVVSQTLGFHVDYDKTLGQQFKETRSIPEGNLPVPEQTRLDSLIEKCETAIRDMHRPIAKSKTATKANLLTKIGTSQASLSHTLTEKTYEHIAFTDVGKTPFDFSGRISSYNINTFKGRVYIPEMGRPIPFELSEGARGVRSIAAVVRSLAANAQDRLKEGAGDILFEASENRSRAGRLKSLTITQITRQKE